MSRFAIESFGANARTWEAWDAGALTAAMGAEGSVPWGSRAVRASQPRPAAAAIPAAQRPACWIRWRHISKRNSRLRCSSRTGSGGGVMTGRGESRARRAEVRSRNAATSARRPWQLAQCERWVSISAPCERLNAWSK